NGCDGTGNSCTGGTNNWGLSTHTPKSNENGNPWRMISRDNAIIECQSLGTGYDLITNSEWQTIARNIEARPANWTGGAVGSGCIYQGNNGHTTCGYVGGGPLSGAVASRNSKSMHVLSNNVEIWDFSGNAYEWVKDDNSSTQGPDGYVSQIVNGGSFAADAK